MLAKLLCLEYYNKSPCCYSKALPCTNQAKQTLLPASMNLARKVYESAPKCAVQASVVRPDVTRLMHI